MAKRFTVSQIPGGQWAAFDVRGSMVSGPHSEEWQAHLYGGHWSRSPSQVKQLRLKRNASGALVGRPFYGVSVTVYKTHTGEWRADAIVDGEARELYGHNTRRSVLSAVQAIGREQVETVNILNRDAGPIAITRADKGGCTDPGTERYHCM